MNKAYNFLVIVLKSLWSSQSVIMYKGAQNRSRTSTFLSSQGPWFQLENFRNGFEWRLASCRIYWHLCERLCSKINFLRNIWIWRAFKESFIQYIKFIYWINLHFQISSINIPVKRFKVNPVSVKNNSVDDFISINGSFQNCFFADHLDFLQLNDKKQLVRRRIDDPYTDIEVVVPTSFYKSNKCYHHSVSADGKFEICYYNYRRVRQLRMLHYINALCNMENFCRNINSFYDSPYNVKSYLQPGCQRFRNESVHILCATLQFRNSVTIYGQTNRMLFL